TGTGISSMEGNTGKTFTLEVPRGLPGSLFFNRNHRLIAVDTVNAMLHVLDTSNGEWQRTQLMASEIQGFTQPQAAETQGVVLPILTVVAVDSTSGDFYVGVNKYSFTKGATILKFDE